MENDEKLIQQSSWSTAISLVISFIMMIFKRLWSNHDNIVQELKNAEEDYRKAVHSKDADAIAIAANRLQSLRKKL